jgi:hypothetical protein
MVAGDDLIFVGMGVKEGGLDCGYLTTPDPPAVKPPASCSVRSLTVYEYAYERCAPDMRTATNAFKADRLAKCDDGVFRPEYLFEEIIFT